MSPPRPIPLAVAALSLAAVVALCLLLAQRIVRYNRESGRVVYVFMEVTDPEFTYAGRQVVVTEAPAPREGEYGAVTLRYGESEVSLPITTPTGPFADQLPGLTRYEDWLKVLRFAPLTGHSMDSLLAAIETGEERDRLALVVRANRPGVNPETWGRVWRKDWVFDIYEFMPDGTLGHERFAYPTARKVADTAQPREQGGVPELDSRSWQFQAADLLMPKGSAPKIIAGDSPLVAAGWVFPATVASVIVATASLMVAFAPARSGRAASEGRSAGGA